MKRVLHLSGLLFYTCAHVWLISMSEVFATNLKICSVLLVKKKKKTELNWTIQREREKKGQSLSPNLITYVWKAVSQDFHGACIHRPIIYAHSHSRSRLIWQDSGDWAAQDSGPLPAKPKTDEHYMYIPFSVSPAARTIPFHFFFKKPRRIHLTSAVDMF